MFRKLTSLTLTLTFLLQQTVFAYTASLNLSGYLNQGPAIGVSDRFRPINLRYFSYQPQTNDFKVLLDKGDSKDVTDTNLKGSASVLLDYFKIGLSLPNDKFWVNLRPDSQDQIIDEELAKTDIGKVMLEADLKLKQDTSLFTSPKTPQGKEYWNKLYQRAGELFGTENITIPTLTRPWIVPGEIILRESQDSSSKTSQGAYIYKANLKVMLEEDYLKTSNQKPVTGNQIYSFSDPRLKELNQYSTQLIRELILPKLTQKVNSSKDYANLRQVYFSLILARWFKETFSSQSTLRLRSGQAVHSSQNDSYIKLINSNNLTNLTSKTPWDKTTYFNAYQKSFKEGEYNLSEPVYTPTGQAIRRYMSGGAHLMVESTNPGKYTGEGSIVSSAMIDAGDNKVLFAATSDEANQLNIQNAEQPLAMASSSIGFFKGRKQIFKEMEGEVTNILAKLIPFMPKTLSDDENQSMRSVRKKYTINRMLFDAKEIIDYWRGKTSGNDKAFNDINLELNVVAKKVYAVMENSYKKMIEDFFNKNKKRMIKEFGEPLYRHLLANFGEFSQDDEFILKKDEIHKAGEYVENTLYRWNWKYSETPWEIFFQAHHRWVSAFGEFKEVKRFIKWQQLEVSLEANNLPMVVEESSSAVVSLDKIHNKITNILSQLPAEFSVDKDNMALISNLGKLKSGELSLNKIKELPTKLEQLINKTKSSSEDNAKILEAIEEIKNLCDSLTAEKIMVEILEGGMLKLVEI